MLNLKYVPIRSFNENIAYVHTDCEAYKTDDIRTMTRVEIHGGAVTLNAFLQVTDDISLVQPDELGLNAEAFDMLGLPEGARVTMVLADAPQSIKAVKRKIQGNILTAGEYKSIVGDILQRKYSNIDIAAFLSAFSAFSTAPEIVSFVQALLFDKNLFWDEEDIVADCYTLGDIPGNNTDLLVTAIAAAYGMPMPKVVVPEVSSCFGSAHTMRVFADIDKNPVELARLIKENRGAVVSYKTLSVYKALSALQSVAAYLNIKDEAYTIVRLLALKAAAGITHLVVDIPVGPKTLIKTSQQAIHARKLIEYAGDVLGLKTDVVITDGREPVGAGVGALLEARDIRRILRNKDNAPKGLLEKALFLAGRVLEFDPAMRGGQGYEAAKEILTSGRALEAFDKIITAQGRAEQSDFGTLIRDVMAENSGKIMAIDNKIIRKIAMLAGAIQYSGAGVYLFKKVGDEVAKGDVLYRIISCDSADFAVVNSFADADNGYDIARD